jgi:hypothetical protein
MTLGWCDYHVHLDRAYTFDDAFFAHEGGILEYIDSSLRVKQSAVGVVHRGQAYKVESLYSRMSNVIEQKVAAGEVFLNAIIDCSPDIEGRAFECALNLREAYKDKIEINVGAYSIFGFETFGSEYQWHLEGLAPRAQFLVGLPERDAQKTIGFDGHLAVLLDLAYDLQIPLQVHVDQTGDPEENGTERLIEAVHWKSLRVPKEKRPKIWAVHCLSPSSYDEDRFWKLVTGLKKNDIGVIVCPRAVLSNRQLRSIKVPMHNSIARWREFLLAGIDVRWGTDNVNDLFMSTPKSPLLSREIGSEFGALQDATRFYDMTVIDKVARGEDLNQTDLARVERSLKGDYAGTGWHGLRPWRNI